MSLLKTAMPLVAFCFFSTDLTARDFAPDNDVTARAPLTTKEGKEEYGRQIQNRLQVWDQKIQDLSAKGQSPEDPKANLKLSLANTLDLRRLRIQADLEQLQKASRPQSLVGLQKNIERQFKEMDRELEDVHTLAE